jgi:Phage tail protein (Tail_P2_I)
MDLTLAPSINDTRGQAILAIVDQRMKALDLTPILVYRIGNLPDSAVLAMAWQWDVLDPSWTTGVAAGEAWDALSSVDLITSIDTLTSQQNDATSVSDYDTYRQLIESSVPLHTLRGTPAAILTAVAQLGFPNAILQEGQSTWGGASWPASQGWAVFRVVIPLAPGQNITARQISQIIGAATFWKNIRSWLDSVQLLAAPLADALGPAPGDALVNIFAQFDQLLTAPSDLVGAPAWAFTDNKNVVPLHDTRYLHIGTTYAVNEPAVPDSGVVVNGVAIGAAG